MHKIMYFRSGCSAKNNLYNSQGCGLHPRQLHGKVLIVVFIFHKISLSSFI